jgi:N6-adenosine-specific RNA methylase IME4
MPRLLCPVCRKWFAADRKDAVTCSGRCRTARQRLLQADTPPLPEGPFDLIAADPAWDFVTRSAKGQGRQPPYRVMDHAAICRLPVAELAAPDSVLALWVYGASIRQTIEVAEAWGFPDPYKGLVWLKLSKGEKPTILKGYAARRNCETMWFAKRGKGLTRASRGVRQGFITEDDEELEQPLIVTTIGRQEHSRKPAAAYEALEQLYGPRHRIELFARRRRPGWVPWGNQIEDDEPFP